MSSRLPHAASPVVTALAVALASSSAWSAEEELEEVVVLGETVGELGLDEVSGTASRLGLRVRDTPAAVDIVTSDVMRARGYSRLTDAVESLPGVISGDHPSAPSSFSVRGFTGGQITVLRDGLWIGPAGMVMRPQNTFNLERVEVLRGPSSVLNGQGAVGSTINAVTRSATIGAPASYDALLSVARFDAYQVGLGAGGSLRDNWAYRIDASTYGAEGYVKNTDPKSTNVVGSIAWQARKGLVVKLSADYLNDDVGRYFGTPLVPLSAAHRPMTDIIRTTTGETVDADMRFINYNVSDGRSRSNQLFLRTDLDWALAEGITLRNSLYRFDADRKWINAEGYAYCTQVVDVCTRVGDIQRYYGYFFVFHDQEQWGDRLTLNVNRPLGAFENRFMAGAEVTDLDFVRTRGFRRNIPPAPGDSVDPYDPVPGVYGPLEVRGSSPTKIQNRALFVEDALRLAPRWNLVTALRYEEMDLERHNYNAAGIEEPSGFARDYDWFSYRAGLVFNATDDVSLYGQYSNAKDPVAANVFLVNNDQDFDLTDARQWEVGAKASLNGGRTEVTLAWYDILRKDVQQQFAPDSTTNVGSVGSHGLELAAMFSATPRWRVGANAAWTQAQFKHSANVLNLAGNRPPNVPRFTADAWTSYRNLGGLPLEIGAGLRYVGERYGDNFNAVQFRPYTLLDTYAAWTGRHYRVSLRVDNVTDEPYVAWADVYYLGQTDPSFIYANQVMLGAPRTWSLTAQFRF